MLAKADHRHPRGDLSTVWDTKFYVAIARHGYPAHLALGPDGYPAWNINPQAFFPLYPMVVRAVSVIPGLGLTGAGVLVSTVASVVAAVGIYRVGKHLRGHDTGMALVALWAVFPAALTQQIVYSDSLFIALAAWALYFTLTRSWIPAGAVTAVAGLARPSSAALIAAVGITALVAVIKRQDGWRPWLTMALAPLGLIGYVGFTAARYHRLDAYFYIERYSWGYYFDGGHQLLTQIGDVVFTHSDITPSLILYISTFLVLTLPLTAFLLLRRRFPAAVAIFALGTVLMTLATKGWQSTLPRYFMPAFPLLIPLAEKLGEVRAANRAAIIVTMALLSGWYAGFVVFYTAYGPP